MDDLDHRDRHNRSAMKSVAIYARTSQSNQNIDVQLNQLRDAAGRRRWKIVEEYVDDDVSSRRRHRPDFERMLVDASRGRFTLVAAVALDRYARSTTELLALGEKLQSVGVDFISLREQIDTSTAVGKLTFTVLSAIAEFERELIRERVMAGLAGARKRGKQIGRPRREVDAARVAALREQGVPWPKIAARLQASESTCRRVLRAQGSA
ncbi:MAG: recombinase family protein [Deltaproteobacteria bacterium]|nr:recombinase family protein [Deltaproteobacteria bacterium]